MYQLIRGFFRPGYIFADSWNQGALTYSCLTSIPFYEESDRAVTLDHGFPVSCISGALLRSTRRSQMTSTAANYLCSILCRLFILSSLALLVTTPQLAMAKPKNLLVHLSVVEGAEGSGPQYSVKLFQDGTAEYEGFKDANVRVRGKVSYTLPPDAVTSIQRRLHQARLESIPTERPILNVTRAFGVLVVNLGGAVKRFQVSRDHLELMEVFRDVQSLLATESLRCPYEEKNYGSEFGSVDRCKFDEAFLDRAIAQLRHKEQRRSLRRQPSSAPAGAHSSMLMPALTRLLLGVREL